MKLSRLSKLKIQLDHKVPVYIKGFDKPTTRIDISIRYKKDKDTGVYNIISKSVSKHIENLAFRWKIGDISSHSNGKYKVNGIKAKYGLQYNIQELGILGKIDVISHILVDDETFISKMREEKLNDILKK